MHDNRENVRVVPWHRTHVLFHAHKYSFSLFFVKNVCKNAKEGEVGKWCNMLKTAMLPGGMKAAFAHPDGTECILSSISWIHFPTILNRYIILQVIPQKFSHFNIGKQLFVILFCFKTNRGFTKIPTLFMAYKSQFSLQPSKKIKVLLCWSYNHIYRLLLIKGQIWAYMTWHRKNKIRDLEFWH